LICAFIAEHRARFGVVPICRVLSEYDCQIAPRTFYAWAWRPPSNRALWDLVITDIEMPGMTGIELLRRIHLVEPSLPVAVVTAHAPTGTMHEALLSEADAYLSKPIRIDQLISTATDLIRNGRKIRSTSGGDG